MDYLVSTALCTEMFLFSAILKIIIPSTFFSCLSVKAHAVVFLIYSHISYPENIDDVERQWKVEFHRWSSYMMHWKSQFDHYSKQERCTDL